MLRTENMMRPHPPLPLLPLHVGSHYSCLLHLDFVPTEKIKTLSLQSVSLFRLLSHRETPCYPTFSCYCLYLYYTTKKWLDKGAITLTHE